MTKCAEAERRAEFLLRSMLDKEQLEQFLYFGHFSVRSRYPGRVYRIQYVGSMVGVFESGRKTHSLCAQTTVPVPVYDRMLLHKLFLEAAEDKFSAVARRWSGYMM